MSTKLSHAVGITHSVYIYFISRPSYTCVYVYILEKVLVLYRS